MPPHIPLLPLKPLMHLIPTPRITRHARDHMAVHMWHTLPRRLAVLDRDVEGFGVVYPCQGALDFSHGVEEVADLLAAEVGEPGLDAQGRDEDVAGEEGLEVYEGEAVGG